MRNLCLQVGTVAHDVLPIYISLRQTTDNRKTGDRTKLTK